MFMRKRNPRVISWTQVYRRVNKKGVNVDVTSRKKQRKHVKIERAIVGVSLEAIAKKKAAKPAGNKAAAIKELKKDKKEKKEKKSKKSKTEGAPAQKAAKTVSAKGR